MGLFGLIEKKNFCLICVICELVMSKKYFIPQTEVINIQSASLMIPTSDPSEPGLAPRRLWRPGPGASYDPQANIL